MINPYKAGIVVVIALAVVSVGYYELAIGDNIGNQLVPQENTGTLNLFVYDSPLQNLSAVYMTFTSISLYENIIGWENYSLHHETVNILHSSSSNATLLKGLNLSPQNFTSVKLYLTSVMFNTGGTNKSLSLTSNQAYFTHGFSVVNNRTTNVRIEFDLSSDINFKTMQFSPNGGGSTYTTGTPGSQDNGTLNMYAYDAPNLAVSAVYLTFSNISLHGVQTGWENYSVGNRTVNILGETMANASLLGNFTLGPQNYTMIRLFVTNVTVTINGINETFRMAAPFAMINHPFNVTSNGTTDAYIQFNLASDLNLHSKMLKPVVGATFKS